jgi:hypothetical protein
VIASNPICTIEAIKAFYFSKGKDLHRMLFRAHKGTDEVMQMEGYEHRNGISPSKMVHDSNSGVSTHKDIKHEESQKKVSETAKDAMDTSSKDDVKEHPAKVENTDHHESTAKPSGTPAPVSHAINGARNF